MVKLKRCNEISDYDAWLMYDSNPYWNEEDVPMESIETSIKMDFRLIKSKVLTATVYGKIDYSESSINDESEIDSYTIPMEELGYSKWLQDLKKIIDKQTDNKDLDNVRGLSVENLRICLITGLFKQNDKKVFKMTNFNESEGYWIEESNDLKDAISEDSAIAFLTNWFMEVLLTSDEDCIKAIVEGEKNLKGTFNISFEDKRVEEREIEPDPPERDYDDYY
jgi:hypothetical protein